MKIKKSFTLIETIVVIAVIGLTLPILFAIILTLMREQVKIYRLSQIKREGDYLINLMENDIRGDAVTIYSTTPVSPVTITCDKDSSSYSGSKLYFLDKNEQWFGYEGNGDTIASASANNSVNLTSNKILVTTFSIGCSRASVYSPASVLIDFDICYDTGTGNCNSSRPEEIASLHYQTRIKLGTY